MREAETGLHTKGAQIVMPYGILRRPCGGLTESVVMSLPYNLKIGAETLLLNLPLN